MSDMTIVQMEGLVSDLKAVTNRIALLEREIRSGTEELAQIKKYITSLRKDLAKEKEKAIHLLSQYGTGTQTLPFDDVPVATVSATPAKPAIPMEELCLG